MPELVEVELAGEATWHVPPVSEELRRNLTALPEEEQDAIADGEPYCFRCGRPASSFPEYDDLDGVYTRVEFVHNEEGTYNPKTNRFACDACYIAIGTPSAPGGWRAP